MSFIFYNPTPDPSRFYVDNKEFYQLMLEHRERLNHCKENGLPNPKACDEIGYIIMQICKRLMSRYNFQNYTWRDEMENAAITDCVASINKFDPEKSRNPFAYFTQIAYRAAVRVILEEKKQSKVKGETMSNIQHFFTLEGYDSEGDFESLNANDALEFMQ